MASEVIVIDYGLKTLDADVERKLRSVLDVYARIVLGKMRANIEGHGETRAFFDTGATADSVLVEPVSQWERDIGPTTHYAIYGELGWEQTTAWGHAMKTPRSHAAIGFAKAALEAAREGFIQAIRAAVGSVGKPA